VEAQQIYSARFLRQIIAMANISLLCTSFTGNMDRESILATYVKSVSVAINFFCEDDQMYQ
jgi:hypothetical protein